MHYELLEKIKNLTINNKFIFLFKLKFLHLFIYTTEK